MEVGHVDNSGFTYMGNSVPGVLEQVSMTLTTLVTSQPILRYL